MGFGSRKPPEHLHGQPGGKQVWKYRGREFSVEPYARPRGRVWASSLASGPFADPEDTVAGARHALDVGFWLDEVRGGLDYGQRSDVTRVLWKMALDASDRSDFAHTVADHCAEARKSTAGRYHHANVNACEWFDALPLGERRKLLDAVWAQDERAKRGIAHAKRVQNPRPKPKASSKAARRKLLNRLLRT
jgi:hypothetical protein